MELNAWTKRLRALYDKATELFQSGNRDLATYFTDNEVTFLRSIGLKPINVFDFVEDRVGSGEPDWDTFLLIAAARRDFFLHEQKGEPNPAAIRSDELPPRQATLGDIAWLPRIIVKAQCFLEGGLCHDIMYCCGGDRNFLARHHIHPADFLRVVWAARGDDQKILAFVQSTRS